MGLFPVRLGSVSSEKYSTYISWQRFHQATQRPCGHVMEASRAEESHSTNRGRTVRCCSRLSLLFNKPGKPRNRTEYEESARAQDDCARASPRTGHEDTADHKDGPSRANRRSRRPPAASLSSTRRTYGRRDARRRPRERHSVRNTYLAIRRTGRSSCRQSPGFLVRCGEAQTSECSERHFEPVQRLWLARESFQARSLCRNAHALNKGSRVARSATT